MLHEILFSPLGLESESDEKLQEVSPLELHMRLEDLS